MSIAQILRPRTRYLLNQNPDTQDAVLTLMLKDGASAGLVPLTDLSSIVTQVLKREELGSTGVGHGVAIPHARSSAIDHLFLSLCHFPNGVDWRSLDEKPVYLVCLLIGPCDRPGDFLRASELVSRMLRCNFVHVDMLSKSCVTEEWLSEVFWSGADRP